MYTVNILGNFWKIGLLLIQVFEFNSETLQ